jgi:hypothetical protein
MVSGPEDMVPNPRREELQRALTRVRPHAAQLERALDLIYNVKALGIVAGLTPGGHQAATKWILPLF